ncbi:MAG: hypothetical protein ACOCYX_04495, partial [Spirochaetota bacterium]
PTAYPRQGYNALDPSGGLASVEALQLALWRLGIEKDVLRDYPWREAFLRQRGGDDPQNRLA